LNKGFFFEQKKQKIFGSLRRGNAGGEFMAAAALRSGVALQELCFISSMKTDFHDPLIIRLAHDSRPLERR
jgi:hypothetical protein